ncbi:hypothetical protein GCM10027269_34040 [Kribbella endophytica]
MGREGSLPAPNGYGLRPCRRWLGSGSAGISRGCPNLARPGPWCRRMLLGSEHTREVTKMLSKVFPIELKPGKQAEAEAIVAEFAPRGPEQEAGTLSFRVYRDPARPDYLLFVEHFADQAAYDAHTGSAAYKELVAGRFAGLIVEFVEIDHELLVSH